MTMCDDLSGVGAPHSYDPSCGSCCHRKALSDALLSRAPTIQAEYDQNSRILRLEQMVKTLSRTVMRLNVVINTGYYEIHLGDVLTELKDHAEFKRPPT
jgi:hypothetical protein